MNKKFLSMMLLAIFALGIVAVAVPVRGAWGDVAVSIETPDIVVPGGGIYLSITGFPSPATGTTYFWLSKEADEEVMSGDIQIGKMASSDVEDELTDTLGYITVYVPTTGVKNVTYYVKVSGSRTIGADASVSDNTIDVITENLPTITVDPTSGTVGEIVDVSGADIASGYWGEYAELYWHTYYVDWVLSDEAVDYGEFTASDAVVPTDLYTTMGVHKILVLLYDGTYYLGTFVEFEIEPSIELTSPDMVTTFSIEEGAANQGADFVPHGFPKGTIKANTVKFVIRDIVTGALEESFVTTHDEVDITKHGTNTAVSCSGVDDPPAGTVDLEITADTTKIVVEDAFVSSSSGDRGDLRGKMSATEGHIGDDVTFSAIWLPAGNEVDIEFYNAAVNESIWLGPRKLDLITYPYADVNGGWVWTFTIEGLPGGTYTVRLWDVESSPEASYTLGKFKVLSEVVFYDELGAEITSTHVDDPVYIEGTAFPIDASFRYITIGTGKVDLEEYVEVADDFTWSTQWSAEYPDTFPVPHTSGGGKEVTVVIKGKDAKGKAITVEGTIKVKPIVGEGYIEYYGYDGSLCQYLDYGYPTDYDWGWMPYTTGETIFAGHPMNITGWGFLAGEAVSVKFVDPDTGDVIGTATITDGGTAKSNGDLEVIFQVPTGRKFKFERTFDVHVVGTTKTNKYIVDDVTISGLDDSLARLFFNLQADGELDTTVHVGDEVTVVGVGFAKTSLTLQIAGEEVKDVTTSYGYFKTTVTIPELVRGGDYYVEEISTDYAITSVYFNVTSAVTLSPSKAGAGTEITASGTGFAEDETVDVYWPEIAEELVEVDADSDGLFTTKFKVPVETPGTYTITFDAEELAAEDDPTATFILIGPLKIVSLSVPTEVYNGSSVTISVTVQDYFGVAVAGATVTGSVTPPGAAAVSLTFTETPAGSGVYTATYAVPADAKEGTYAVSVKASKPDAGSDATATGTFYVSIKLPPVPPVDITKIMEAVAAVTSDVSDLSGSVSTLSSDVKALSGSVSKLSTDLADLKTKVAAIPIIPVELVYGIAIISIIAAIAAIAAVISIYRKIA